MSQSGSRILLSTALQTPPNQLRDDTQNLSTPAITSCSGFSSEQELLCNKDIGGSLNSKAQDSILSLHE